LARINLINSKTVFFSTLIVVPTLTLIVYLTGINKHRSLYLNSILSTSILSTVLFLFIFIGLYRGWKIKDNLGNILDSFDDLRNPGVGDMDSLAAVDFGGDIGEDGGLGCLFSFIAWIVIGLFGAIILWFLGAIFWAIILTIAALLYWIIFRAFRLIFRNASYCKANIARSFGISILFTFLYNCWIYAIIFGAHFLIKQ
jgi:hypothetical protein